jgi:hypothetical protein
MVLSVRNGNVDGLERYLMYEVGMWMGWKGALVNTQCAEWDCGWLGEVPHVWNGVVDGLERCLDNGLVDDY